MSDTVRELTRDLHTYVTTDPPKGLLESLNVVSVALSEFERAHPGYNAGGTIAVHRARLERLANECQRKRPTASDGKHGSLHTDECGCKELTG